MTVRNTTEPGQLVNRLLPKLPGGTIFFHCITDNLCEISGIRIENYRTIDI